MYMNLEKWIHTFTPEQANHALLLLRIIYLPKIHSQVHVEEYLRETWNAEQQNLWTVEKVNEEISTLMGGLLENKLLIGVSEGVKKCERKPIILRKL
ncbi:MAG: hypothetical protein Q8R18_06675 [bacterium]|nr:hypothetical protein [bacterium]